MKMPLAFKIPSKLMPRWNEQGKRPRENTIQYEDAVSAYNIAESKTDDEDIPQNPPKPRLSKLSQAEATALVSGRRKSDLFAKTDTLLHTPEYEQREMVQCIAARVLLLQQADVDLEAEFSIPGGYDALLPGDRRLLAFVGSRVPSISFVKYVERLVHNINRWAHERPGVDSVGIQSAILAIQYLERAKGARITPRSIHRYFLGAFLAGIKFNFDYYLSGTFWAGVGGVRVEELNFLEIEFCSMLGWNLYISPEDFDIQFHKTKVF